MCCLINYKKDNLFIVICQVIISLFPAQKRKKRMRAKKHPRAPAVSRMLTVEGVDERCGGLFGRLLQSEKPEVSILDSSPMSASKSGTGMGL